MKHFAMDALSIICCIMVLLAAIFGLVLGIGSIGAEGLAGIGVLFIPPSVLAILIILTDLLVVIRKKWVVWPWVSTAIKGLIIGFMLPTLFRDLSYAMRSIGSNLRFDVTVIVYLIIIAVPSVWCMFRDWKWERQKQ